MQANNIKYTLERPHQEGKRLAISALAHRERSEIASMFPLAADINQNSVKEVPHANTLGRSGQALGTV